MHSYPSVLNVIVMVCRTRVVKESEFQKTGLIADMALLLDI